MSRIIANNIRHNDATADSLSFDSSGNVSAPGNLSVTGTTTFTDDLNVDSGSLFVDASTDRVGIGVTDPAEKLEVSGTGGCRIALNRSGNDGYGYIGTGTTNDLQFGRDGSGSLEYARFLSGGGLTFNGDTAAANALDDYEEGTWDPVYNFSTSGDATVVSAGRYIKVGSIVHVQGYVYINNSNSLSGNVLITGLPFASSSSPSQRSSAFVIGQARAWPGDDPYLRLLLEPNSTGIKMFNNDTSAAANARLTNANFTAAAEKNIISFSGAYTV